MKTCIRGRLERTTVRESRASKSSQYHFKVQAMAEIGALEPRTLDLYKRPPQILNFETCELDISAFLGPNLAFEPLILIK